jgi:hypothetical protein
MITFDFQNDRNEMQRSEKVSELLTMMTFLITQLDFKLILNGGPDSIASINNIKNNQKQYFGPRGEINLRQIFAETDSTLFKNSIIYLLKSTAELNYQDLDLSEDFFEEVYSLLLKEFRMV